MTARPAPSEPAALPRPASGEPAAVGADAGAAAAPSDPPVTWQPGRILLINAVFCVLVAAAITASSGEGLDRFPLDLLFSEAIGTCIALTAMLLRRLPRLRDLPPGRAMMLTIPVAIPFGYVTGHLLVAALTGVPVSYDHLEGEQRIGLLATLLASGFWVYYSWTAHRLAREAAARAEAQRQAAEMQLRLLRAQLEPHMLFNTLAGVRALMEEDVGAAQRMVDQLIVYLRAALQASRTETTTLGAEFAQLQAYLELMALRMGPRLSVGVDLPPALATASVPTMLLQPLVENAIRHGLEPQVGPVRLELSARRAGATLELCVADTGRGLPAGDVGSRPTDGGGYGLAHVRERLQAMHGDAARLALEPNLPRGTRAIVSLPA